MTNPEAAGPQQSPGDQEMSGALVSDPLNVCFSWNMRSDVMWKNVKEQKKRAIEDTGTLGSDPRHRLFHLCLDSSAIAKHNNLVPKY